MRNLVLGAAMAAVILPQGAALAQPAPPPRYDDRYDDRYEDRYENRYDDRTVADMDAAQRRFDAAQARFDRERDAYERERQAFEDARARFEAERERLAAYDGPTWRGADGQTYCRRSDGTVGTIIGGVAGALLGRAIDGGRRSAVGTIIGGGAGALAGRSIERGSSANCR
jgi:hypothetical protein